LAKALLLRASGTFDTSRARMELLVARHILLHVEPERLRRHLLLHNVEMNHLARLQYISQVDEILGNCVSCDSGILSAWPQETVEQLRAVGNSDVDLPLAGMIEIANELAGGHGYTMTLLSLDALFAQPRNPKSVGSMLCGV
jgi:hypothetical protein